MSLYNDASLILIPSGIKEDTVFCEKPSDGSGDLSFTRASNGTRVNSAGLVEVVPWNLLQQSENYSVSPWNRSYITVTPNDIVAPNGTTTGNKIVLNNSGSQRYQIQQALTTNTSLPMTFTFYAKKNQIDNFVGVIGGASGMSYEVQFNLTNVTATEVYNSSGINTAKSIESVGNGWYKCTITAGSSLGVITSVLIFKDTTGNGTDSFYIWGAQLNIGSTAKPYFPTTDRLNVPRLTYQNGGGGCPSLLLEKQSTNSFLYSEDFLNAYWVQARTSITANSILSPDGTQNADVIFPDTSPNTSHELFNNISTSSVNGWSGFFKFQGQRWVGLFGSGDPVIFYDLQNGVIGNVGAGLSGSITNMGNGWYRCTYIKNSGTNTVWGFGFAESNGSMGIGGTPNTSLGFGIWGFQAESGSYTTSYIPTTSSSATRVADACFKTGIGSLFGTNKGTFFWQGVTPYFVTNAAQYLWDISDTINFNLNRFALYMVGTNTVQLYTSVTGGNNATLAQNSFAKIALVWNGTSCSLYINGALAIANQTISNSNPTAIHLNTRFSLNENGNTEVGEVVVFNTNLTNAELIALTTI